MHTGHQQKSVAGGGGWRKWRRDDNIAASSVENERRMRPARFFCIHNFTFVNFEKSETLITIMDRGDYSVNSLKEIFLNKM
jgi:hypothetical protein